MGLFSSKTKVYVGTSVVRAVDDAVLPNSSKSGLMKAILNSGDVPAYVMEDLVTSIGVRAERMYAYAARSYTYGLPSGATYSSNQGREEAEAVLTAIEGQPVSLDYCQFGPPNSLHIGWMEIIARYGYDPVSNTLPVLSAQKGKTVYLEDMVVVVPASLVSTFEKGSLDQWGSPPTAGMTPWRPTAVGLAGQLRDHSPVNLAGSGTEDRVRVDITWSSPPAHAFMSFSDQIYDPRAVQSIDIPITPALADPLADYFHVKYTVNGAIKYWMYKAGQGTHPTLDALFDAPPELTGTYFPICHFRSNGQPLTTNNTTPAYKTSKKMLKYLGMDYATIGERIDSNPEAGVIQQAMMIMAVPANTSNPIERRYLFQFFENLFFDANRKYDSRFLGGGFFQRGNTSNASIVIQDGLFKMVLSDGGIVKKRVVGSIGPIGSYSSGMRNESTTEFYKDEDTQLLNASITQSVVHYYRKQVTAHMYDEIAVNNLRMAYYIYGGYTDIGDGGEGILLIPIDRSITREYSMRDREELYSRSLHFVFNSLQIVKVKWYQTGIFKAFVQIVGIILTVASLGTDGGFFAALAAASTTALTSAIITLIINLLVSIIVQLAFKLFVKLVGSELAFLIAIVAAVVGAYQYLQTQSLAGAPWAKDLLQLSSNLTKAISNDLGDKFGALSEEYGKFSLFKTEEEKKLEEANKLLESKSHLNPFIIFGETPNDFYNRTIHSGNPGLMSIGAISAYVDTALTLPKLDATIGNPIYE